jgi:hypothetical protein
VLTLPHALRPRIAYDRRLLGRAYAIFYDSIQRFYLRRLAALGFPEGRTGSVTAIQRASSDLRLNPHLHGVWLDGVFVEHADGELGFVELPELSDMDVGEVLQTITARVLGLLRGQGALRDDDGCSAQAPPAEPDGEELVLNALATAASFGQSLAGPETRAGRVPDLHPTGATPRTEGPLCVAVSGFSLHASTRVHAGDKPGRERLIKYILRPPVVAERVERLDSGRVRLRLKRTFSDGTWAVEMDELSLCARLAALVPPPWQNQVRYSGVLAPASKWRSRVVPQPPPQHGEPAKPACEHDHAKLSLADPGSSVPALPRGEGSRYWPWRLLKARTFGDATTKCTHCGGELTLRALVQDRQGIHRILTHLGLPTDVPKPAPARGPPYYRGPVRRIRPRGAQQHLPY